MADQTAPYHSYIQSFVSGKKVSMVKPYKRLGSHGGYPIIGTFTDPLSVGPDPCYYQTLQPGYKKRRTHFPEVEEVYHPIRLMDLRG